MVNEAVDNQALVSLIIPVYNAEVYLVKCLDSLLNQTYRNLEIILVDDGSTDKSLEICNSYAENDSRIVVIHQTNAGVCVARNTGLSHCHGTYLGFVDADDWVDSDFVTALVTGIGDKDMVVCGFHVVEADDAIIEKHVPTDITCSMMEYLEKTVDDELLIFNGEQHYPVLGGYLWNKLFRRAVWENMLFEEGKHFTDTTAVMAYLGKIHCVQLISSCHYYYLQRDGSITHSGLNKNSADFVEMRKKQKAFIIQQGGHQSLVSRADLLILFAIKDLIRKCLIAGINQSDIIDFYLHDFHDILRSNGSCLRYVTSIRIFAKFLLVYFWPAVYVRMWHLKNG